MVPANQIDIPTGSDRKIPTSGSLLQELREREMMFFQMSKSLRKELQNLHANSNPLS